MGVKTIEVHDKYLGYQLLLADQRNRSLQELWIGYGRSSKNGRSNPYRVSGKKYS